MAEADTDDDPSLQRLISQRKARPTYARMVSWEFRESSTQLRKHRRRKNSSKSQDPEVDLDNATDVLQGLDISSSQCISDGVESCNHKNKVLELGNHGNVSCQDVSLCDSSDTEGEYLSAAETLSDSVSEEVDEISCDLRTNAISDIITDPQNLSIPTAEDESENLYDYSHPVETKQRLSKKKKKKKRKLFKMVYVNQVFSLGQHDLDVRFDIGESTSQALQKSIAVVKEVATLSELCIKSLSGVNSAENVPKLLMNKMKGYRINYSFRKFQLSWLQNIMAANEPFDLMIICSSNYHYNITLPTRNIWNFFFSNKINSRTKQRTEYIPFTYVLNNTQDYGMYEGQRDSIYRSFLFLSVLAATVDLMMPYSLSLSLNKKKPSESEEKHNMEAVRTAVTRVKLALKARFPSIIEKYFHLVLPYVLWARGDVRNALENFSTLTEDRKPIIFTDCLKKVHTITQDIPKATYLYEIGRMYILLDDTVMAAKFYRLAADCAIQDSLSNSEEVEGQSLMLQANLYDQGKMTLEKTMQSTRFWEFVITSPYKCTEGAARYAIESFLCFHAGSWKGQSTSWIEEAVRQISQFSGRESEVLYHLSMMYALMGDAEKSKLTYRQFIVKQNHRDSIPGSDLAKGSSGTPWKPLVDMVSVQGQPESLKVIWRVQLCPMRITNIGAKQKTNYEADLCGNDLHLRLNSDRYLTGDMQMMLPPLRNIQINPYTGALVFKHQHGKTECWKSHTAYKETMIIPTPVEIYCDDDGVEVELVRTNDDTIHIIGENVPYSLYLVRTGVNGERAKVNLMNKMKDHIFKCEKQIIERNTKYTAQEKKEALKILQYMHNKGWCMSAGVCYKWVKRKKREEEKSKKAVKEMKIYEKRLNLEVNACPVSFRKTLVLQIANSVNSCSTQYTKYKQIMFIDCSSKESFINMQFLESGCQYFDINAYQGLTAYPQIKQYHNNRLENADIIYYHINVVNQPRRVIVYDETGSIKDEIPVTVESGLIQNTVDACGWHPLIIGSKLFAVNGQNHLWSRIDGEDYICQDFTTVENLDLFGEVLVVKTINSVGFASSRLVQKLKINVTTSCYKSLCLTLKQGECEIQGTFSNVFVAHEMKFMQDGKPYTRAAIVLDTHLALVEVPDNMIGCSEISLVLTVQLPGFLKEVCFIGEHAGFVVTWTQSSQVTETYREHLFHFDFRGRLIGVLQFLGVGPRSFFPVHLSADEEVQSQYPGCGDAGNYLFFRDGHNGIMGIKLF